MRTVTIQGKKLTVLPALIDPHVHFRVPGLEHKEDWTTAARAAARSGISYVCDMPNTQPPSFTALALKKKRELIDSQLAACGVPLGYGLYLGADCGHLEEIEKARGVAIGVKIFMGCSTGGLVMERDADLDEAFRRARLAGMVVAVHAEDELILREAKKKYASALNPALHSMMRPREAAIRATEKALALSAKYHTTLYILHVSTKEELELIAQAKKSGVPVFAEAVTHHLFFSERDYEKWGTLVQMNPPLRTVEDNEALWEAVRNGTIDTIGTDHAPHTLAEKSQPFGLAPSGIPGIETLMPLLLDACHKGMLSLSRLVELTRTTIQKIFSLEDNDDCVVVDLELEQMVDSRTHVSKCGWSPYDGKKLTGWPLYTVIGETVFGSNLSSEEGRQELQDGLCVHRVARALSDGGAASVVCASGEG